jgi:hypothetical protein
VESLFQLIEDHNKNTKLAIVFDKLELFGKEAPDFMKKFRNCYPNAYAFLPKHTKFFNVYPLGEVLTTDNGDVIPPTTLRPRAVLDPVRWMIGF